MNISNDYPAATPERVKKEQGGNLLRASYYKIAITAGGNTLQEVLQTGDSPQSPQSAATHKPIGFDSNG